MPKDEPANDQIEAEPPEKPGPDASPKEWGEYVAARERYHELRGFNRALESVNEKE